MTKLVATVADGRRLAIAMLAEFREVGAMECSCEDHFRPGRKQRDILGGYLDRLREMGPDAREGFCIVINDVLALASESVTDIDCYQAFEKEGYDRNAAYFAA